MSKSTPEELSEDPWSMIGVKKYKYVRASDISPAFMEIAQSDKAQDQLSAPKKAVVVDDAERVVKASAKGEIFFTLVSCLAVIGYRLCSSCNIPHLLSNFKIAETRSDGTIQLRGKCRDCEKLFDAAKRAEDKSVRYEDAENGVTKVCATCGEEKSLKSYSEGRASCNTCKNNKQAEHGKKKAEERPDLFKYCAGSGTAKPLHAFDEGNKTSRAKLEIGKKSDAREERKEYHRELNNVKKYWIDWRAKKKSLDSTAFLQHLADRQRAYYAQNAAKILEWTKTNAKSQFHNTKGGAKERGIPWELEEADAMEMISSPCFYSGIFEPDTHTTGIDRLDSKLGYILSNCVPCNGVVNMLKGDMDVGQFWKMISDAVENEPADILVARYNNCMKRGIKCQFSLKDLCGAIANHFDPTAFETSIET